MLGWCTVPILSSYGACLRNSKIPNAEVEFAKIRPSRDRDLFSGWDIKLACLVYPGVGKHLVGQPDPIWCSVSSTADFWVRYTPMWDHTTTLWGVGLQRGSRYGQFPPKGPQQTCKSPMVGPIPIWWSNSKKRVGFWPQKIAKIFHSLIQAVRR